ncbi:MAG: beta-propeller domain-containing protein [Bacilli bacterium]|nr:beta-propeller domain-containing protein [Bacilli bacterium]HHU24574.1 hypothetical protein [Acholeplasmataceae bacterium]
MKKRILVIFTLILGLFLITSCLSPRDEVKTFDDYGLLSVKSLDQLKKLTKPSTNSGWWRWWDSNKEKASNDSLDGPGAPEAEGSSGTSKTNVQVEGVDESDVVKNDDRYIYIVNYVGLTIVDTETEEVYHHNFPNFSPNEIFLYENYLVMLGTVWEDTGIFYPTEKIAADVEFGRGCFYQYYFFKTIVLDVANPEKPETIREFTADGSYYLQGRMIDNTLYLVLQKNNIYLSKENKVVLPSYSDSAESVTNKPITLDQIKIIGGDDYYYCYTLLVSFNVDEKSAPDVNAYLGYFSLVYSSENNLYATRLAYFNRRNGEKDGYINNDSLNNVYYYPDWHTIIYRFNYQNGKMVYQGKGMVKGELHNQFSMDEYEGVLRVAHTYKNYLTQSWELKSESFVSTFSVKDEKEFEFLASVGGMGIDELIYSVRFDGPLGYIVTFKTIDPLYVVDLTNPEKPIVKSELKSPGVSDYLHMINDKLLLGVGRSTEETSYGATITKGVKVSLFDVSNPNETKEVDILFMEGQYSYTELQYNHKALLTLPSEQIYALPVYCYYADYSEYRQGMYVFDVDVDTQKLNYRGLISHFDYSKPNEPYYYYYSNVIVRGVVIDYKIYTISQSFVAINLLDDNLTHVKYLHLTTDEK